MSLSIMSLPDAMLDAFDFRTTLACENLLAIVFAVVFYGIHRVFPEVRGVRVIALSFILILPDTLLLAFHGHLPTSISVLMANTLLLGSMIALYEGVVDFTGARNDRWMLWFIAFISFAAGFFYTEVRHDIVPSIIAVTLAMAAIRGVTAVTLLRRSFRSTRRRTVRVFGLLLAVLASIGVGRAWLLYRSPIAPDRQDDMQSLLLIEGAFFLSACGLCFLVLISKELIARRRVESQRDPVSGTYNRHALQANLALELERLHAEDQVLTIAFVALDDLVSINEREGHPAGNAAIRAVAECVAGQLRASDHVGRYGSDEFLLLFPRTGHIEALIGADRIARRVGHLEFLDAGRPLTLSIGITEAQRGDNATSLLARAHEALAQAKADGHNCRRLLLPTPATATADDHTPVTAVA